MTAGPRPRGPGPARRGRHRVGRAAAAAWLGLAVAGCGPGGVDDALTVATAWPAAERARWGALFREASGTPAPVRWVVLAPGDDPARLAARRHPPDLILGGPATAYEGLARRGLLEPDGEGRPAWRVARRAALGTAVAVGRDGPPAFDDPRRDPVTLARARAALAAGDWAAGYAGLVRSALGARPAGRRTGAALAAVERGAAGTAPAVAPLAGEPGRAALRFEPDDGPPAWAEGVGVPRAAGRAAQARALLDELAGRGRVEPPGPAAAGGPEADALLADLLGATLVDARDELRDARAALGPAGAHRREEAWMTEAPPWPPASVARLLRSDTQAMAMVETLAAQVAPEADVRAWLLRSWLAEPRRVDGALLAELAAAADGRLAREPRFRAWLRGEWTAWARQRYRRVARRVRAGQGVS